MNARIAFVVFASLFSLPALAADVYVLDPVHSQPQWEATHIGFSKQHGNFGKLEGKVMLDRSAKTGRIDVTIETSSIRTYDARLDAIVKGERYFDVEKYPTITFHSTDVKFDGDRLVAANGELTMHGVTKPVMLTVADFKCGANTFNKKPMCAAEATTTIKRSDFGMTNGLNIGNPGDEIRITLPVEAYLEQPQG
ncbi:MAG TPA: YceI family protein [Casimicrobiaceae bacterium]|nr:YceI family protein [Casimicrobiaceae bacterium]